MVLGWQQGHALILAAAKALLFLRHVDVPYEEKMST